MRALLPLQNYAMALVNILTRGRDRAGASAPCPKADLTRTTIFASDRYLEKPSTAANWVQRTAAEGTAIHEVRPPLRSRLLAVSRADPGWRGLQPMIAQIAREATGPGLNPISV